MKTILFCISANFIKINFESFQKYYLIASKFNFNRIIESAKVFIKLPDESIPSINLERFLNP